MLEEQPNGFCGVEETRLVKTVVASLLHDGLGKHPQQIAVLPLRDNNQVVGRDDSANTLMFLSLELLRACASRMWILRDLYLAFSNEPVQYPLHLAEPVDEVVVWSSPCLAFNIVSNLSMHQVSCLFQHTRSWLLTLTAAADLVEIFE